MPRGAPRGGGAFVPRGGNFVRGRAAPRGLPSPRSRGGFVPRRPTGMSPVRGRGRARGGPDAYRGPGGPPRGRGGRARGRGRGGGNSFFDHSDNNYPDDRVYVEEEHDDDRHGGYDRDSKVRIAPVMMFDLGQYYSRFSERVSDFLAALPARAAKNWTISLFIFVQGYGKYRASELSYTVEENDIPNLVEKSSTAISRRKKVIMRTCQGP